MNMSDVKNVISNEMEPDILDGFVDELLFTHMGNLFEKSMFNDFVIKLNGEHTFKLHKFILFNTSDYFKSKYRI
jgi:hypothetical protein